MESILKRHLCSSQSLRPTSPFFSNTIHIKLCSNRKQSAYNFLLVIFAIRSLMHDDNGGGAEQTNMEKRGRIEIILHTYLTKRYLMLHET